ncbi:MAG TPA: poly(A) polymerase [Cyanobacteria bacterium UBA11369]|nr:poly(A) polymerase [Cyanobacteria bacterium UBA11371]HBE30463.1 poly(A) polymerase [Cyanobacteria bacterium UBA11368]HBE50314.1 poly(A) polymerase [Cyanobacteria bacterium UBA11369]
MDLVLCHTTADFDALGAAVGLTRLKPGAKIVLTGGAHPAVRDFLALHRDEYALIERRSVNPKKIRSIAVVDTQLRDRTGIASQWFDLPHLTEIVVYDHHPNAETDIPATRSQIEPVGATTTLIVEHLQKLAQEQVSYGAGENVNYTIPPAHLPTCPPAPILTPAEATVMALGIHVDTGSLTYDGATPRDAAALAWLMAQGASLSVIAEYIDPGLSPKLQQLLKEALEKLQKTTQWGYTISSVLLQTPGYIPGLSSLASRLVEITESDALLLAAQELQISDLRLQIERGLQISDGRFQIENSSPNLQSEISNQKSSPNLQSEISNLKLNQSEISNQKLTIIGRSHIEGVDLNQLFQPLGGGGHSQAASLILKGVEPQPALERLVEQLTAQIQQPPTARELMSSPVRTIRPETTIGEAQRVLLRYGHSGLSVVNAQDELVGVISRRDIDIALHHGFAHAPVKGYMTTNLKTINPDTPLTEIESIMVTYDIGRLPVLENNQLVGIVTRTDVLRQLHQDKARGREIDSESERNANLSYCPLPLSHLRDRISPPLWQLLTAAAHAAEKRGWHLYLVGGAVRDLLLADNAEGEDIDSPIALQDIDMVVDGFHRSADAGAGVELARELQKIYPNSRLEIHGAFQTAALLWHKDPELDNLWVDIATARTEFYPYPAANPEVEASSIRQDLYRRDFTINALAVRITAPRAGKLLDFFGGLLDLQAGKIRVLHANSFIEDPTRIYRAVRFAVRLGFEIEPQTQGYIRHAIASGIYEQIQEKNSRAPALETRLKSELKYILQAPYWKPALRLLAELGALRCIHPTLELTDGLWWQVRLVDRCLQRFAPQEGRSIAVENSQQVASDTSRNASPLQHWQMRLEVLIASLKPPYPGKVASNLQLPADSIQRLSQLQEVKTYIVESLAQCDRISQIVFLLRQYQLPTLILIAAFSPREVRRQIWRYLSELSHIKAPLNGNDLKALGYKPGRQFKEILDALLVATLDGEVSDRTSALAYLAQRYPQT